MNFFSSSRSLTRATLPGLPLAFASLPSTQAEVIGSGPLDFTIDTAGSIYFDLDQSGDTLVGSDSFADADFRLFFDGSVERPKAHALFEETSAIGANSRGYAVNTATGLTTHPGDGVDFSSVKVLLNNTVEPFEETDPETGELVQNPGGPQNNENWEMGSIGYLSLYLNGSYGWAQLTYGDDFLTLHEFAYDKVVTPIPEPAAAGTAAGLGALLVAGTAAIHRRRRAVARP